MSVPNRPQPSPKITGTVPSSPIGGRSTQDADRPQKKLGTVTAQDMADRCHGGCDGLSAIYLPDLWKTGIAFYVCEMGHRWTCGWGHMESGH